MSSSLNKPATRAITVMHQWVTNNLPATILEKYQWIYKQLVPTLFYLMDIKSHTCCYFPCILCPSLTHLQCSDNTHTHTHIHTHTFLSCQVSVSQHSPIYTRLNAQTRKFYTNSSRAERDAPKHHAHLTTNTSSTQPLTWECWHKKQGMSLNTPTGHLHTQKTGHVTQDINTHTVNRACN